MVKTNPPARVPLRKAGVGSKRPKGPGPTPAAGKTQENRRPLFGAPPIEEFFRIPPFNRIAP